MVFTFTDKDKNNTPMTLSIVCFRIRIGHLPMMSISNFLFSIETLSTKSAVKVHVLS
jgi:hypothetical protein